MGCQSTMRFANYCQLYSYRQCQKCCLVTLAYFFHLSALEGLHLGLLGRKNEKRVYSPAELEAALPMIQGRIAK
jgi:hypothetical protein